MEYLKVAVIMVLYTKCLKREYQIFVNFFFNIQILKKEESLSFSRMVNEQYNLF